MSEKESHPAPVSDPIIGHGGTAYEGHDVHPGVVIWSLAIVAALALAGFGLMLGVQKYLESTHPPGELASPLAPDRIIPPAPQLQVHPWEDLPDMRANENKVLAETGRDQAGRMHIPIDSAMTEVLSRLKIDPNAPRGLTTPGGQGLEYSHSLSELPPAYHPQIPSAKIQGEIRTNAK
jgi:hypothetical protein